MNPKQQFLNRTSTPMGYRPTPSIAPLSWPQKTPGFEYAKPFRAEDHRTVFEQSALVGLKPSHFSSIVNREQNRHTSPDDVQMIGGADPSDRGLMQVNENMFTPKLRLQFKQETGREYDYNKSVDSIIAARIMLQDNLAQWEQMRKNGTLATSTKITPDDIVDSYNAGASGVRSAKEGSFPHMNRIWRYRQNEL